VAGHDKQQPEQTTTDSGSGQPAVPAAGGTGDGVTGDLDSVVGALKDPAFYSWAPAAVEVRETAISWVFLAGDRAFKLKKPIVLPFLDYASAERRREMCEREIELNRRLAPDLYLGVQGIVRRDGRLQLAPPGPNAIEHVVAMRRFDEANTLAAMVADGRATAAAVATVGQRLASFHADARVRHPGKHVLADAARVAHGNFEALLANGGALDGSRVFASQRFGDAFLAGHASLLLERGNAGWVREGHGDLRAEHVLMGAEVQVVDCVEFDEHLRIIDVGADLAFLVMDLARLGRPDLGRALIDAYRQAGGDPGPDNLIAYHAAVRAWVRAKVAALRANDSETEPRQLAAARAEALELFALGERFAWHARLPLMAIICGPPGSGKSTLAQQLAELSGLPLIASDEIRKRLSGLEPTQRGPQSLYSAMVTERTYAELGRCASEALDGAGGVFVDGTFRQRWSRNTFSRCSSWRVAPLVFECRAPEAVTQARALVRERGRHRVSDAGPAVAARLRQEFDEFEYDVPASRHFVLRTDQPVERVVADVMTMLDRRLAEPDARSRSDPDPASGGALRIPARSVSCRPRPTADGQELCAAGSRPDLAVRSGDAPLERKRPVAD
jgi:aminoglycoside phosphotransferase family enzyme/predicted kinase